MATQARATEAVLWSKAQERLIEDKRRLRKLLRRAKVKGWRRAGSQRKR